MGESDRNAGQVQTPLKQTAYKQIVPDTSFVISLLKQRRDFEDEMSGAISGKVRIVMLDLVVLELERLARIGPSAISKWAKANMELLHKRNYPVVEHKPGPSDVDSSLIAFAISEKTPTGIATLDRELITALKILGLPTVRPRARHGLIVEGFL
jgi:rRNA-processing protein FCF1